jgi:hypothetical protein
MKKRLILMILLVIFSSLIFFLFFNFSNKITGKTTDSYYLWTKAICNETHCQDYEIVCEGKNIISQTPVTGAIIEISNEWEDSRNENDREKFCG